MVVLLVAAPLLAQQPAADVIDKINREAGLEMKFRTPAAEYASLALKPVGVSEVAGHKAVRYSLSANGLTATETYSLMTWDLGEKEPTVFLKGLKADAKGALRCGAEECSGGSAGAEVVIALTGMSGQPRRFVLSDSKKAVAMGEVVPFPATSTDGGCSIEAVLLSRNAEGVLILAKGFEPNEKLDLATIAFGELSKTDGQAEANGTYMSMLLPYVEGHAEGTTTMSLTGMKCRPTTTFRWGAYKEE